jgi:hypothetical protein
LIGMTADVLREFLWTEQSMCSLHGEEAMDANQPRGESRSTLLPSCPLYVEGGFYKRAGDLRSQFDQKISATQSNGGLTPLGYAFDEDRFQFLTVSPERVFELDILDDLMKRLCSWARGSLGVSHVSTPQVRVYIDGCRRRFLRDDIAADWHYMLSIGGNGRPPKSAVVKVVNEAFPRNTEHQFRIDRVLSAKLDFNQMLLHPSSSPYAVEVGKTSMNPLDGAIFLDGYMW